MVRVIESSEWPLDVERIQGKTLINIGVEELVREDSLYYRYSQVVLDGNLDSDKVDEVRIQSEKRLIDTKKEQALKVLVVSTDSGKVFYADTDSRLDLQAALVASELEGTNETMWKLAEAFEGSRVVSVSVDEIREAVVLALKAKGKLVIQ